ncbi:MAG TPA: 50S ribosomal protein L24 [Rhodanobacteraceae bacterium]|nr:50S ribosomal protein L24 [Rhodanobacteraceae bacterium]
MNRIKKGDQVIVIAGKNKGQRGDVMRVDGDRVFVSNVNLVKRHTKPNPQAQQPGGIVEREASIHASNVMLFNPATGKGDRVGHKMLSGKGKDERPRKVRVFRSSGEVIDA